MNNKPIIGIITRKSISEENHHINIIYKDIVNGIFTNGGIPIGVTLYDDYKLLIDMCDGIIFQGGDDFEKYDLECLKYAYEIDKPVLGICLGMQLMGVLFDGFMLNIKNHKKTLNYAHEVKIKRNSKLYNIFKTDIIKVNSRHKSIIKNTKLNICAVSKEGYIEAVEDTNKKFFIGVQWHPESMLKYDHKQNNLFKCFIKSCQKKF
ncbi:MAG: gamma-glutamyl-gamma-aminobutyrate hydrolase family protein [Bacilli bacterium]|nr:gamma-glutamyl-gamma-aminobutyrate hydrolase family protein [Bacilli bacterium]